MNPNNILRFVVIFTGILIADALSYLFTTHFLSIFSLSVTKLQSIAAVSLIAGFLLAMVAVSRGCELIRSQIILVVICTLAMVHFVGIVAIFPQIKEGRILYGITSICFIPMLACQLAVEIIRLRALRRVGVGG